MAAITAAAVRRSAPIATTTRPPIPPPPPAGIFLTAPSVGRASCISPGRGLKRKVGCFDQETRIGRRRYLRLEYTLGAHLGKGKLWSHPGVVTIQGVFEDRDYFHLVVELCPGGRLFDKMTKAGRFSEDRAVKLIAELVSVLKCCHEMGVVHRDVKPENILLTAVGKLKLADFRLVVRITTAVAACLRRGVAHRDIKPNNILFDVEGRLRLADSGSVTCFGGDEGLHLRVIMGTAYFAAPEVVAGREFGEKFDVWSAGVVLYMMRSGAPPFGGETVAEVFEVVLWWNLRFLVRLFWDLSPAVKDLI